MRFEKISIAAFAREIECDPKAVRRAINEGYISKAIQKNAKGRILGLNKGMAAWEWLQSFAGRTASKKHIPERLQDIVDIFGAPEEKPKSKAKPKAKTTKKNTKKSSVVDSFSSNLIDEDIATLKKKQEVAKTETAIIELAKLKGELIEVKKVEKSMYDFGLQVKSAVLSVPERIADELMACESRNELYLKLSEALRDALNDLAEENLDN